MAKIKNSPKPGSLDFIGAEGETRIPMSSRTLDFESKFQPFLISAANPLSMGRNAVFIDFMAFRYYVSLSVITDVLGAVSNKHLTNYILFIAVLSCSTSGWVYVLAVNP